VIVRNTHWLNFHIKNYSVIISADKIKKTY
jgi:hypothetical protein